jgi:hypothetical protein
LRELRKRRQQRRGPMSVGVHLTTDDFERFISETTPRTRNSTDVPEQPHRDGRSPAWSAPRAGELEFPGARSRASSASCDHE